ncbi:hypothetical protein AMTR_s00190p00021850 [Amborella trichopoda]|uniref:Uncharacterized protein n=1 Tax=Amborella trichopoda TaxID=13333 RepID=U5DDF3_AMBTC|nr:hypothetical protein AMTR_s00190p00021850 [Amborella trichopoda]
MGYITHQLGLRLSARLALGAGQGLIGRWMVRSGLEEPESEYALPRVSPYRLATFDFCFRNLLRPSLDWSSHSYATTTNWFNIFDTWYGAAKARTLTMPVSILVCVTAISGVFVAGNDAVYY